MKESDSTENAAESIRDIMRMIKAIPADVLKVFMIEVRLFGHTARAMLKLCILIGLLLAAGWLFVGASVVVALESLQAFNLISALALVGVLNLVLAGLFIWWLKRMVRDLTFRETRCSVDTLLGHARSAVEAQERE